MAKFRAAAHLYFIPPAEWLTLLRHQLIRLVVGKLPVVANAKFEDGTLILDRRGGLVFNCTFIRNEGE